MKPQLEKLFREKCTHPHANGAYTTDKGSDHDYILGYYASEFEGKQDSVTDILEIGVMSGGSLMLWHHYFNSANIEGTDVYENTIKNYESIRGDKEFPRITIHIADIGQLCLLAGTAGQMPGRFDQSKSCAVSVPLACKRHEQMQQVGEDIEQAQVHAGGRHDVVGLAAVHDARQVVQQEQGEHHHDQGGDRQGKRRDLQEHVGD